MKNPFIVSGLILASVTWFHYGSADAQGAPPEARGVSDEAIPDDISIASNIRYREGAVRNWTLDLAVPKERGDKPRPAIIVIHGGGWIEGDKSSFSVPRANRPP